MQLTRRLILAAAMVMLGSTGLIMSALAQSAAEQIDWQRLNPDNGEFTVDMPKDPKFESGDEPYHRMTLHTSLYLATRDRGPVFAIVSLSGIKSNPAQYSELERTNSYVDAFKNWFPQKVRGKDALVKLTLVGDKPLNGNPGRDYRLTIGDLSGTARTYVTRKRFYAVVVLNVKKDDVLADRFLSSFMLPERSTDLTSNLPTHTAGGDAPTSSAAAPKKEGTEEATKGDANPSAAADAKTSETNPPAKATEKGPISGGVLNGKAISLPVPEYPAIAAQAGATGTVVVQVTIDETGSVISARAVSGHPLLQSSAVAAAQQARFSPTSLMGEPVKVTGVITYNFTGR
jgi:TonB family protein